MSGQTSGSCYRLQSSHSASYSAYAYAGTHARRHAHRPRGARTHKHTRTRTRTCTFTRTRTRTHRAHDLDWREWEQFLMFWKMCNIALGRRQARNGQVYISGASNSVKSEACHWEGYGAGSRALPFFPVPERAVKRKTEREKGAKEVGKGGERACVHACVRARVRLHMQAVPCHQLGE